jgi:hypothetical protein
MSDTTALFSDNHKLSFQPEVLLFRKKNLSIVWYNFLLHHYNSLNETSSLLQLQNTLCADGLFVQK